MQKRGENGVGSVRQRVTKGLSSAKSLYSLRLRFPKCERGEVTFYRSHELQFYYIFIFIFCVRYVFPFVFYLAKRKIFVCCPTGHVCFLYRLVNSGKQTAIAQGEGISQR